MPVSELKGWGVAGQGIYRDARAALAGPPRVRLGVTSLSTGDMKSPEARRRALEGAGLGGRPAFLLKQVHGVGIVPVSAGSSPEPEPEGDGWVTDLPGPVLCVFVADCMPVFLWEAEGRAAGVFHAGWRGAQAGMAREAVRAFQKRYGIKPAALRAAVGPHIRACCYRVGPEVAGQFRPSSVVRREDGLRIDLGAEARAQLEEAGVPQDEISVCETCTSCSGRIFFSFRRDKQDSRMMAFLSLDA